MEQSQNEANLSSEEIARYARHISLPEIGIKGQEKLKTSSVACIGTGGLGSPLLIYLAAAGIGRIGIVDFDVVEYSNLQRQIIHTTDSIGLLKTDSAKQHIRKINPSCRVDLFNQKLTSSNALEILKAYDVICDCSDNFPTRYLINDACLILNKPNIYGSIARFEGQVSVFNLKEDSPNYRDLIPTPPPQELIPSCSEAGVMGILPGIIGTIQAAEAIKIITNIGYPLNGRILIFNALKMQFKELTLKSNPENKNIHKLDRTNIPGCTYSRPQIASIGLTEEKAKEKGINVNIGRFPFNANGKALASSEEDGFIKTIFDKNTGALIGAHLIGHEVTELINSFAIAKSLETTEEEIMNTVFPHPTLSEAIHESVLDAFNKAIHI